MNTNLNKHILEICDDDIKTEHIGKGKKKMADLEMQSKGQMKEK